MKVKSASWLMAVLMCGTAIAGVSARPNIEEQPNFLEATVPKTFGEWTQLEESAQIVDPATAEQLKKTYREVVSRTYVNKSGYRVMLSLARSGNQIGIQRAHLPVICYPAQGFKVSKV